MQPFSFSQARNQDDALVQLRQSGSVAIAGGTTLVDLMKLDVQSPPHLVDIHAVLGGSEHCVAAHPSDMAVALVALDAVVHIIGPQGERRVPIEEFHKLPGDTPHIETAVQNGELITYVTLPKSSFAQRSAYVKLRDRASYEFALASAAVAVDMSGSTIRQVRVALGGVATKPWRSHEAEQALTGAPANADTFRAAAEAALKSAKALRYNAFKIELAKMPRD